MSNRFTTPPRREPARAHAHSCLRPPVRACLPSSRRASFETHPLGVSFNDDVARLLHIAGAASCTLDPGKTPAAPLLQPNEEAASGSGYGATQGRALAGAASAPSRPAFAALVA